MGGLFADKFFSMSTPAALYRCACTATETCADDAHEPVATGPLIIMVHGLLALPPERRREFKITSRVGDLDANAAAEAIRFWSQPSKRDH
ncbi:hypothetical protein [Sphingomonas sp. S2-65]|uniref:hypothetical protein n=1 Tax=Sphingomonas sp. S2-65 TaxID=2903960 RepID=UPI001F358773|nr:hypothetical protein [Sphingomonas sp. S2-65]UYY59790.1 hypothetical protein LZ586_06815 [Sphingomonas sp. S2-65]